jgi:hypothetical protein
MQFDVLCGALRTQRESKDMTLLLVTQVKNLQEKLFSWRKSSLEKLQALGALQTILHFS